MPDLLLELYSEEIPARMQARAADDLRARVTEGLVERGLAYAHATALSTPRRLALAVTGLPARSPDLREERKGPRVDAPEAALEGFLRATGLTRDQLERRADKKAEVWFAVATRPGRPAAEIVAETVEAVVRGFPWPKSMRWGAGELRWVRPLQSILCLLSDEAGAEVVALDIDGIVAGDATFGHPFLGPGPIRVSGFEDYEAKLQAAFVRLDPAERRERIEHDARQLAFARGLELVEDAGLLDEIAGLVEWPVALAGRIEARFLELPPEVLRTSMKAHQKFLSLRDPASGRIEGYVVVANRDTADGGAAILAGNARVLAARLSDAAFFWENDLATPLEAMAGKLDAVTFHGKLGTQGARIGRIAALAREIAPAVGADPDLAERAARLAKADLASEMVYEFPELQGVMGRYYALKAGEDAAVADAARDHYAPLGPSDATPSAPVSVAVALADKIDMLTGFWWHGIKPSGSGDPFALRRAAVGVIRIIVSNEVRLRLLNTFLFADEPFHREIEHSLFREESGWRERAASYLGISAEQVENLRIQLLDARLKREGRSIRDEFPEWSKLTLKDLERLPHPCEDLLSFFADRLKVHLRDEGVRHDVIDAGLRAWRAGRPGGAGGAGAGVAGVPRRRGRGEPADRVPAGEQHPRGRGEEGRGGVFPRPASGPRRD